MIAFALSDLLASKIDSVWTHKLRNNYKVPIQRSNGLDSRSGNNLPKHYY